MNSVLRAVAKYNRLAPGDTVLCALSTGADSTCMTHALALACREMGITLAAAHFTHGLRPHAAEREKKLAADLCASLGIELFFGEGDTRGYARQQKLGLEEAARDLRYRFLRETLARWHNDGKIATAHNLGDQAETVLFNLIRGAGLAGMKGIAPVGGNVIRPLIETSRAEIERYLELHSLPFAVDETNADSAYSRNRLRNEILPALGQINPRCAENLARAGYFASQALDFIDSHAEMLIKERPHGAAVDAKALSSAHEAVAARAVLLAYARAASGAGLASAHIGAVAALARSENPSASLDLPLGVSARREYGELIIEMSPVHASPDPVQIDLNESVSWGGWRISISENQINGAHEYFLNTVLLPLTVRARLPGDRIAAESGGKTVKKLMIERKIPKNLRDITPVLCDNIGVLCVGGIIWARPRELGCGERIYIHIERE